jgi:hypothetical protein
MRGYALWRSSLVRRHRRFTGCVLRLMTRPAELIVQQRANVRAQKVFETLVSRAGMKQETLEGTHQHTLYRARPAARS